MDVLNEKAAFNARAKASMREFLRAKSWEEKVESIERMNAASKLARKAMSEAIAKRPNPAGEPDGGQPAE
jgi:hypothetical protein